MHVHEAVAEDSRECRRWHEVCITCPSTTSYNSLLTTVEAVADLALMQSKGDLPGASERAVADAEAAQLLQRGRVLSERPGHVESLQSC